MDWYLINSICFMKLGVPVFGAYMIRILILTFFETTPLFDPWAVSSVLNIC